MARIPSTAERWQFPKAGTRPCSTRADCGSWGSEWSLNQAASLVCDNLARMPCAPGKPIGPIFSQFGLCTKDQLPFYIKKQDFTWLLRRSLTRTIANGEVENNQPPSTDIPVWSEYNSIISSPMPLARVGNLILKAAPAHEWQTLLTILMEAQNMKMTVVGQNRRTVIKLDMGLYPPADDPSRSWAYNTFSWSATRRDGPTSHNWCIHRE